MLEIGNGGMTADEYKTHMTLWAILAAPLLAGNDLSKMSATDKALLTNKEVIAIDQDSLGKQGDRIWQSGDFSIWTKPLSGGRTAVAVLNGAWDTRDFPVNFAKLGLPEGATVRDVWEAKDLGRLKGIVNERIPKHAVKLYVFSK